MQRNTELATVSLFDYLFLFLCRYILLFLCLLWLWINLFLSFLYLIDFCTVLWSLVLTNVALTVSPLLAIVGGCSTTLPKLWPKGVLSTTTGRIRVMVRSMLSAGSGPSGTVPPWEETNLYMQTSRLYSQMGQSRRNAAVCVNNRY